MEQCILFRGYSPPYISRAMPLWKFCKLFVSLLTPPIVYIRSSWNFVNTYTMMWSSAYLFKVTVHQILPELCPIKNFHKFFISGKLLQFTSSQAENWFIVIRPWCAAVHIISRLQYIKYWQNYAPLKMLTFCFRLTLPMVYIQSSWNFVNS